MIRAKVLTETSEYDDFLVYTTSKKREDTFTVNFRGPESHFIMFYLPQRIQEEVP